MDITREQKEQFISELEQFSTINGSKKIIADLLLKQPHEKLSYSCEQVKIALEEVEDAMRIDLDYNEENIDPESDLRNRIFDLLANLSIKEQIRSAYETYYKQNNLFFMHHYDTEQFSELYPASTKQGIVSTAASLTFGAEEDSDFLSVDQLHTVYTINPEHTGNPISHTITDVTIDDNTFAFLDECHISQHGDRIRSLMISDDYKASWGDVTYRYYNHGQGRVSDAFEAVSDIIVDSRGREYFLGYDLGWFDQSDCNGLLLEWHTFISEAPFDVFLLESYISGDNFEKREEVSEYVAEQILYMMKLATLANMHGRMEFEYCMDDLNEENIIHELYQNHYLGAHFGNNALGPKLDKNSYEDKQDELIETIQVLIDDEYPVDEEGVFAGKPMRILQRFAESLCAYGSNNEDFIKQYGLTDEELPEVIDLLDFIFVAMTCYKDMYGFKKVFVKDFSIDTDNNGLIPVLNNG